MARGREFENSVIQAATMLGWMVHHQRPARTKDGRWISAIAGQPGFPDVVLVKDRVLFRELKSGKARVSAAQRSWINALRLAGADAAVWHESEWDRIIIPTLKGELTTGT